MLMATGMAVVVAGGETMFVHMFVRMIMPVIVAMVVAFTMKMLFDLDRV